MARSDTPARRRGISRRRSTGTDNGGGPHLQGVTERTGPVRVMWGGDGGGICGESQDDSAWSISRGVTELENLVHGGRDAYLSNGLSVQGRPAETPGEGMTGPSSDKDGDAGSLPTPACPGHRGFSGGEKPPPPRLHLMRHDVSPLGTEQQSPCHISVR